MRLCRQTRPTILSDHTQSVPRSSSRWGVFGNVAFTAILVASSISSIGIAMFDTATSWLMTNMNRDPLMVSAVQVATMAPMFLLTVPAGALADVVDPRRLLIVAQAGVIAVGVAFAVLVSAHWATPPALLAATFLLGAAGALAAPAWQIITPALVPKSQLDDAIAVNSAAFNVSRAIGPALGGVAITAISITLPFWAYVATNVGSRRAPVVAAAAQGAGDAAGRAAHQRDGGWHPLCREQSRS